jgi:uncharacterized protein
MRLEESDARGIADAVRALDPAAQVFLFGSRVDDSKKGGDIDLLVLSEIMRFDDKISLLIALEACLGERKIDLVLRRPDSVLADPFVQSILVSAVRL